MTDKGTKFGWSLARLFSQKGLLGIASSVFLLSMIVLPWFDCEWNWSCVQSVWDRWQGLNVGVLALISGFLALKSARLRDENERKRNFQASKAFLPNALCELCEYFEKSALAYNNIWDQTTAGIKEKEPAIPAEAMLVFRDCILHATPAVAKHLASIVADIQVHQSRIESSINEAERGDGAQSSKPNLISYFYCMGKLQSQINRLFPFARNEKDFNLESPDLHSLMESYRGLRIRVENIRATESLDLEGFTRRAIERKG